MAVHWVKWQSRSLTFAGIVVMLGALGVMIIILAVLALVVVKALAHSPWVSLVLQPLFQLHCSWAFTCALFVRDALRKFQLLASF